jgi:alpha-amylase
MRLLPVSLIVAYTVAAVHALTPDEWQSQSIYQLLTDRFARTDGSTSSPCTVDDSIAPTYCGGSWRGIIDRLDYIQGMGFTAVHNSNIEVYLWIAE